jgi:hypothetical protein
MTLKLKYKIAVVRTAAPSGINRPMLSLYYLQTNPVYGYVILGELSGNSKLIG